MRTIAQAMQERKNELAALARKRKQEEIQKIKEKKARENFAAVLFYEWMEDKYGFDSHEIALAVLEISSPEDIRVSFRYATDEFEWFIYLVPRIMVRKSFGKPTLLFSDNESWEVNGKRKQDDFTTFSNLRFNNLLDALIYVHERYKEDAG